LWPGCSGVAKLGLEILGIGLIYAESKDCISLEAVLTPDSVTLGNYDGKLISSYHVVQERNPPNYLTFIVNILK